MTTIKDLIDAEFAKPDADKKVYGAEISDFANLFGLYCSYDYTEEFEKKCKQHWLVQWLCTDTYVGLAAYYLNGELVAISQQNARKGRKEFWFISDDAYEKMRKVVFYIVRENDEDTLEFADLNQHIPDEWLIHATYTVVSAK